MIELTSNEKKAVKKAINYWLKRWPNEIENHLLEDAKRKLK